VRVNLTSTRLFAAMLFASITAISPAFAALPTGWLNKDVGAVGVPGTGSLSGSTFVVDGSGSDVWGTADEFHFTYTTLTGDGEIVAQVASLDNLNEWTKAGVMMRETLTAGSKHAFMLVSPTKGVPFQRRASTNGSSLNTSASGGAPTWVRISRKGSTFTAAKSLDGVTWTAVGSETMNMVATIYVGLAVASHVDGALATASFDNVSVKATTTSTTTPTTSTSTAKPLRLLHWNSHHGGRRTDGVYDPQGFASWLAKFNPDVITLNEVDSDAQANAILSYLKAKMPGVSWTFYFLGYMKGNMILSRFPIAATSTCVVNSTADRRVAQVGVVVNGRTINVWDAHLALDSSSVRTAETRALQGCEKNWAEAKIAAGDYNMQADTAEYNSMTEAHVDAWRAAKALGTAKNYSGNCDGCTRNSRIDYVFTSKAATFLTLKSVEIFDTRNASGVMPSDHKPMLVVYDVK
jgi:endonuclease/exonuclease/phosphatase family metal-dependent hydrolase